MILNQYVYSFDLCQSLVDNFSIRNSIYQCTIYKPPPTPPPMPGDASRLALIDAEIMRCRGAMEKAVLVGGGEGVMLQTRKRNRGAAKKGSSVWKGKLKLIRGLFARLNRSGTAERLVDRVLGHLEKTINDLLKLEVEVDVDWDEIIEILEESQDFFQSAADFQSIFTVSVSPYHFFAAVAEGMVIKDKEYVLRKQSALDKNGWMNSYLIKIARSLKSKTLEYYEKAISPGSGELMYGIAKVLISTEGGDGEEQEKYNWRKVLENTLAQLKQLQRPEKDWIGVIYDRVIANLNETITKMNSIQPNDLMDDDRWSKLYLNLHRRRIFFETLAMVPVIGDLFKALDSGFEIVTTPDAWASIDKNHREATISALLQRVGGELAKVPSSYYDTFLPKGGGDVMQKIASILQGSSKRVGDKTSLDGLPYALDGVNDDADIDRETLDYLVKEGGGRDQ